MPDLLTHYAVSYLLASRTRCTRDALALALVGLLPDIDALFRLHRSYTHSLLLTAVAGAALLAAARKTGHTGTAALALLLYTTHIALDLLTAPTPALWPLTSHAYTLTITLDTTITPTSLTLTPTLSLQTTPTTPTPQPTLQAPIATPTGTATAAAVALATVLEKLRKQPPPQA